MSMPYWPVSAISTPAAIANGIVKNAIALYAGSESGADILMKDQ